MIWSLLKIRSLSVHDQESHSVHDHVQTKMHNFLSLIKQFIKQNEDKGKTITTMTLGLNGFIKMCMVQYYRSFTLFELHHEKPCFFTYVKTSKLISPFVFPSAECAYPLVHYLSLIWGLSMIWGLSVHDLESVCP